MSILTGVDMKADGCSWAWPGLLQFQMCRPAPSLCVPVLVSATDTKGPHHGDLCNKMQKRLRKIDIEGGGRVNTVRWLT